jgi:hypothetical protein
MANYQPGDVFYRLTVKAPADCINGRAMWLCECSCGSEVVVRADKIGRVKSCGCLKAEIQQAAVEARRLRRLAASEKLEREQQLKLLERSNDTYFPASWTDFQRVGGCKEVSTATLEWVFKITSILKSGPPGDLWKFEAKLTRVR